MATKWIRIAADFIQVGQIPALDKWLGKNPKWPRSLYKFDDFSVAAGFSVERFMERMQNPELGDGKKDFLNGFLQAKEEHPELVTDNEVIGYMIINVSNLLRKCSRSVTEFRAPTHQVAGPDHSIGSWWCRHTRHCYKRYLLSSPQVACMQGAVSTRITLCTSVLPNALHQH